MGEHEAPIEKLLPAIQVVKLRNRGLLNEFDGNVAQADLCRALREGPILPVIGRSGSIRVISQRAANNVNT